MRTSGETSVASFRQIGDRMRGLQSWVTNKPRCRCLSSGSTCNYGDIEGESTKPSGSRTCETEGWVIDHSFPSVGETCQLDYDLKRMIISATSKTEDGETFILPESGGTKAHLIIRFQRLAREWKEKTELTSNINEKCRHPAYVQIIGMGRDVMPLILEELRQAPDHWFAALREITGENPVPPEARGKLKDMAAAWIDWAQKHGYSPDCISEFSTPKSSHRPQDQRMVC